MPARTQGGVGSRIAYYRSVMRPKMTQQQLAVAACVSLGTPSPSSPLPPPS